MVEMKGFQTRTRRKKGKASIFLEEPYVRFIKEREGIMTIFNGATVIG